MRGERRTGGGRGDAERGLGGRGAAGHGHRDVGAGAAVARRRIGGDDMRLGWTVGGGFDYAFTNNWFTGVEYRYSQYESKTFIYPIPVLNLGLVGFKQELSSNQVTARLGYKF